MFKVVFNNDCVKGSPFVKLLWCAWYIIADNRSKIVRDDARKYLNFIIESASRIGIDHLPIDGLDISNFALLRTDLKVNINNQEECDTTLGYFMVFLRTLDDEQIIDVDLGPVGDVILKDE